jgi:hypothetical protein
MMSSATSTKTAAVDAAERRGGRSDTADAFQPWHIYALLGMVAAAAAVWSSRNTHPLALVLLSAAALAAAVVALGVHRAVAAFLGRGGEIAPLGERQREVLEREKSLVLRSIKELEFDRAMGKIGDADFEAISSRLRARALTLMQDLARTPAAEPADRPAAARSRHACASCGTSNDPDAKFCKNCGSALARTRNEEFRLRNSR